MSPSKFPTGSHTCIAAEDATSSEDAWLFEKFMLLMCLCCCFLDADHQGNYYVSTNNGQQ